MNDFLQTLIRLDHACWYAVHGSARHEWLDAVIPYFRNQYFWAPVYLFLLLLALFNWGKRGLVWCLGFLLAFALADHISAAVIKPWVGRVRPCNDPAMAQALSLLVPCGGGLSFPSSHATNHFAMAVFSASTLSHRWGWVWIPAIFWGSLVSYSQVYVGVHYPGDVLGGAILGTTIGLMVGALYKRFWGTL